MRLRDNKNAVKRQQKCGQETTDIFFVVYCAIVSTVFLLSIWGNNEQ